MSFIGHYLLETAVHLNGSMKIFFYNKFSTAINLSVEVKATLAQDNHIIT